MFLLVVSALVILLVTVKDMQVMYDTLQQHIRRYPVIHLGGDRHPESVVSSQTQYDVPGIGSIPERSLHEYD